MPLTRLGEAVPSQPQFQQQNGPLPQPMLDPAQQQAVEISNRLAALSKVITDNIDKTSWQGNGGTVGFIGSFDGQLVVTQTAENHKAIQKLLDELRARGRAIPVGGDRRQHGRSKPAGPCGETAVSDHRDGRRQIVSPLEEPR
jgi:hypothetical protein